MTASSVVTTSDWVKGISYSIAASLVGGASKLAIRKSWLMVQTTPTLSTSGDNDNSNDVVESSLTDIIGTTSSSCCTLKDSSFTSKSSDTVQTTTYDAEANYLNHSSHSFPRHFLAKDAIVASKQQQQHCGGSQQIRHTKQKARRQKGERETYDALTTTILNEADSPTVTVAAPDDETYSDTSNSNIRAKLLRGVGMFGMTFLDPFFCVVAMNYASPSILAPFAGLTLVWIVLFSDLLIGEKPIPIQIFAASLTVCGEIIVALWGDHTNDEGVTVQDVERSYNNILFQLFFLGMTIWMLVLAYMMLQSTISPLLRRFAWGVSGGSITGLQNFLKDSLTILKNVKSSSNDETIDVLPTSFYIMALCAILTSFGGLLLLTACMKRYNATYSAATFVGSFVISASIMSSIHYQTFTNLDSVTDLVMYLVGLFILLLGVCILVLETSEDRTVPHPPLPKEPQLRDMVRRISSTQTII